MNHTSRACKHVDVNAKFLSRNFCISYANDIIKLKGTKYWWGKGYAKMSATRIAQELWAHAVVYYFSKYFLLVVKSKWLLELVQDAYDRTKYIDVNHGDYRTIAYIALWTMANYVEKAVRDVTNTFKSLRYLYRIMTG